MLLFIHLFIHILVYSFIHSFMQHIHYLCVYLCNLYLFVCLFSCQDSKKVPLQTSQIKYDINSLVTFSRISWFVWSVFAYQMFPCEKIEPSAMFSFHHCRKTSVKSSGELQITVAPHESLQEVTAFARSSCFYPKFYYSCWQFFLEPPWVQDLILITKTFIETGARLRL